MGRNRSDRKERGPLTRRCDKSNGGRRRWTLERGGALLRRVTWAGSATTQPTVLSMGGRKGRETKGRRGLVKLKVRWLG